MCVCVWGGGGWYLARKKIIVVKMRHVRQSSFVHKRSIHFSFQANISVLGCQNHTTLTCPSVETERADSDVTSFAGWQQVFHQWSAPATC